eukprot:6683115-Lingulodinium_polyedra.AAC.1
MMTCTSTDNACCVKYHHWLGMGRDIHVCHDNCQAPCNHEPRQPLTRTMQRGPSIQFPYNPNPLLGRTPPYEHTDHD